MVVDDELVVGNCSVADVVAVGSWMAVDSDSEILEVESAFDIHLGVGNCIAW